ncbi:hypothetical protein Vretimale_611 [Volvox reticuliferus]|uniref:Uncharacterized protein n=1 Tax=Volvox reticuliferus TaxID=1737510 RepID=A0A8J4D3P7_9CHLO|nr:hypothetical protein Vretifemale_2378 [Volvox reticuliferus]GIL94403.1 hypothetical protein Vretimale_611 [Volvox reticuliferus]
MLEHKQRKKSLLDEDDGDGATGDFGFRVNKEYAARFEHNKRREELHRLQSKYPEEAEILARKIAREAAKAAGETLPADDSNEDSSDDEEEDAGDIPDEVEAKIFDTLLRIRSQDPSIYQKDVHFFTEDDNETEDGLAGDKPAAVKKAKPMYLKDMIAKQALDYEAGGDSSDDEEARREQGRVNRGHPKAYDQEQEALRKAFLEAAVEAEGEGAGDMDGVLHLRSISQAADADGEEDADNSADQGGAHQGKATKGSKKHGKSGDQFQKQLIEAYFGSEAELNPDDMFLKEYIMNKGWVDRDDDYIPSYREVIGDDCDEGTTGEDIDADEDEKYLREVDAFEAKYNFRYEEPGADRIITHPRNIEDTVRKPDDKRKRQRDAKKQRLEEAADAAREEVKRLKNLKKQEIESKLDKLRNVAGAAAPAAASLDEILEGDFDPEEWDKKMGAAFDDDYYAVEEDLGDLKDDLDLLGEDMDGDEDDDDGGGDGMVRFRTLQRKIKEVDALHEGPEGGEEAMAPDSEAAAQQRAELQRLLEEYYKLDYEDNVGGIKTRFRYKEVPASTFGLSVDEILRLDDKALNQVVGIKRLAPYRDDLNKLRPNYKALEMIKGEISNFKGQRRQSTKRQWQKGSGASRQGGQWWREESGGGGGGTAATCAGPRKAGMKAGVEPVDGSKGQARASCRGNAVGSGPSSDAATINLEPRKKRKQMGGPSESGRSGAEGGAKRQKAESHELDPKQARLASYAVPTLRKELWGGMAGDKKKRKGNKQDQVRQGDAEAPPTDGLSRAQRKNLKRSQKRASKRTAEAGADGQ